MKTYYICEDYTTYFGDKVGYQYVGEHRFFSMDEAKCRLAICEKLDKLSERKRWIEERHESLVKVEDHIYVGDTILVDGVRKDVTLVRNGNKQRVFVDGLDITLAIMLDSNHINVFNAYHIAKNDMLFGLHKHIVQDCVLEELFTIKSNGLKRLVYKFTTNAYLDTRRVYGRVSTIANRDKVSGTYLRAAGDELCGVTVYF